MTISHSVRNPRVRTISGLLAASLVVAGCGSTVRQVTVEDFGFLDGGFTQGEQSEGIPAEDGGDSAVQTAGGSEPGAGGNIDGTGSNERTATGRQGGGDSRTSSPTTAPRSGRRSSTAGVTATEIHIGVAYAAGSDAVLDSTGTQGTVGDIRDYVAILVEDLNAGGGVGNRKVRAHFRAFDTTRTDTSAQEGAICSAFTEDTPVFAVLVLFPQTENFNKCLVGRGVPAWAWGGASTSDNRTFEQFPLFVETGSLSMSRSYDVLVDRLVAQGFLTSASKIGVYSYSAPAFDRAVDVIDNALARHGLAVHETASTPYSPGSGSLGGTSTNTQNAVLRFKDRGVDRVLFVEVGPLLAYLFMNAAESQMIRQFRYAITTQSAPAWLALNIGTASAQLAGTTGIGWLPGEDLLGPDDPRTPSQQRCLDRLEAGGQTPTDRLQETTMFLVCDNVDTVAAAVASGGDQPSTGALMAGLERLGNNIRLAMTPHASFGPGRHDGVAAFHDMRWVGQCTCFRYSSEPRPV